MNKDWTGNSKTTFYDIPSFKGRLKINKNGEVFSLITNKVLKTNFLPSGYEIIVLMLKNPRRTKTLYIHRLLAETFLENPTNKLYVNHIDGNKKNNTLENLEWATPAENNIHAYRTGLRIPKTEGILNLNISKRKFDTETAKAIKKHIHLPTKQICELLNLPYKESRYAIEDIRKGKTYKDV